MSKRFRRHGLLIGAALMTAHAADGVEPPLPVKPFTQVVPVKPPPGSYRTSWVGNTFGGSGGPNGFGHWVQNSADEIEVSPDGTVIAGLGWDEAGRCVGLYRDGKVNRVLLQAQGDALANSAWVWGTGNNALTVSGGDIYIANTGKKLLRFRWMPGDLNSAEFVEHAEMREAAVGLNARDGRIAAVYKDGVIEIRSANDLKPTGQFTVRDAKDAHRERTLTSDRPGLCQQAHRDRGERLAGFGGVLRGSTAFQGRKKEAGQVSGDRSKATVETGLPAAFPPEGVSKAFEQIRDVPPTVTEYGSTAAHRLIG